ncbi:peptidoglycan recognition protein [Streptomyces sp. T12]|uniref:peptidoglycan recognition protein family protein n=1 Tax=unclassified Streptomyces TaxID=2593676 RepID=UPI0011AD9AE7|nr:peptidoglycan recognition protein [Streptomyces sp. T12]TWD27236.1 N-acetylmuramoyl-L-alanine amidase [Streptomyces sp. T12]
MRVPRRRPRGARKPRSPRIPGGPGSPRLPRAVAVPLGCLPGVAAAVALVLTAYGVERAAETSDAEAAARPAPAFQAPRPSIVPRSVWLGDAARDQPPPRYDDQVVAVFVHHTDSPNGYDCADAPGIIRGLYDGQTEGRDWDDLGYNFVVDRCGTVYEGRAGGTDRPVTGAHTQGFNHRTAGIAALGTFTEGVEVPEVMLRAIAAVSAWKLGPSGTDPRAEVRLVSSNGGSRYAAGTAATLPAVAGHSDGYMTDCPGAALHARLPEIRDLAARLQGRDAGTGTDRDTGTDTERVELEDDARNEELSP